MAATTPKPPVTGAGPFNGILTWVDQRFPLAQVREAHRALEARKTTGCTILTL